MRRQLTMCDVTGSLAVPKEWWDNLINPGGFLNDVRVPVWVVDGATGMFWEFECAVCQNGDPRPVLQSREWLKYVNWKGLEAGDILTLEPGHDEFRGTRLVLTAWRLGRDTPL